MVTKTLFKTLKRLFKNHLSRFITITCIVVVSIGFMSGIGEVKNKVDYSTNYYYHEHNLFDLNIKTKKEIGFTTQDIDKLKDIYGENNLITSTIYDQSELNFHFYHNSILCYNDFHTYQNNDIR